MITKTDDEGAEFLKRYNSKTRTMEVVRVSYAPDTDEVQEAIQQGAQVFSTRAEVQEKMYSIIWDIEWCKANRKKIKFNHRQFRYYCQIAEAVV